MVGGCSPGEEINGYVTWLSAEFTESFSEGWKDRSASIEECYLGFILTFFHYTWVLKGGCHGSKEIAGRRQRDAGSKLAEHRLIVLELAREQGNVAEACRRRGHVPSGFPNRPLTSTTTSQKVPIFFQAYLQSMSSLVKTVAVERPRSRREPPSSPTITEPLVRACSADDCGNSQHFCAI